MKYFVFAIDDGTIFDKKVIEIFNRYGISATFNLNSGLQGFVWYKDHLAVARLNLEEHKLVLRFIIESFIIFLNSTFLCVF